MGVVLRTLGQATNSPFTSFGSGTDYVSQYQPYDDFVDTLGVSPPVTGAIGDTQSRPILFTYLQIYSSAGSAGTVDLQIASAIDASGGIQSTGFPITTANNDWNANDASGGPQYAAFARNSAGTNQTFYYGFQKNDTNTFTFRRGASLNTVYNPNNIYKDGTSESGWAGTVINARIRWATVSSAPQNFVSTSQAQSSIALDWTAPADDGAGNTSIGTASIIPSYAIYGYRILISTDNTNWSVYGSGTSGSPSGTHDLSFGTGTPAPPSSATVSGLASNTNYYFKVAALNAVTDRHAGATVTPVASRTFGNYTLTTRHTGTNASLGATRTKLATPTVSGNYTATAKVNQAYSSSVTFSQDAGGGAAASTLTYTMTGTLPPGLTRTNATISGTPTTPGSYSVTVTATNGDGYAVSKSVTIVVTTLGPLVSPTDGADPTVRATAKVWNGTAFVDADMMAYDGTSPYNSNGWKYLK